MNAVGLQTNASSLWLMGGRGRGGGGECGSLVYMTFFFTADEIHFICRGKYGLVPMTTSIKMCQEN